MGYSGKSVPIPLGQMGLQVDEPMSEIPPSAAILANNISLFSSRVEKSRGSAKYNTNALGSPVVGVCDWWPTPSLQRMIAATANGKLYRDTGSGGFNSNTSIATGLGTLTPDVCMVPAGAEAAGSARKLFIFTGTSQVQVISGDGVSTSAIGTPAADWSASFPTFGFVLKNRLFAFGNANNRHTLYWSKLDDHSNFASGGSTASDSGAATLFSGEGDGLVSAIVYKGVALLFKRPFGVYIFNFTDTTDYSISRYSDSFGIASPHAAAVVIDDLVAGTNSGTLTSLKATNAFGSFETGDVLNNMRVRDYVRQNTDASGIQYMHSVYYPEKQVAYFTVRSGPGISSQDRMLAVDVSRQSTRITLENKDQPTCLSLRRDGNKVQRPFYGSDNGNIYLMDQTSYSVDGTAYTGEFQTPFIDFGFVDPSLSDKAKLFDFLSLSYVSVGSWSIFIDVFIDGNFVETLNFAQKAGSSLDSFTLDVDRLGSNTPFRMRKPLHCMGKSISFRIYNSTANQYFKVDRLVVSFRLSAEQNRSSKGS